MDCLPRLGVKPGTPRGYSVCYGQRNQVHNPHHQYMEAHAECDGVLLVIIVTSIEQGHVVHEALETVSKVWEGPADCEHHSHPLQDSDRALGEVKPTSKFSLPQHLR
jgi:hypothetical protein